MLLTIFIIALVAFVALAFVVVALERSASASRIAQLHDAWLGELNRNAEKQSALASLRAAHAELQHVFLAQGKELTLALSKAKAAERVQ